MSCHGDSLTLKLSYTLKPKNSNLETKLQALKCEAKITTVSDVWQTPPAARGTSLNKPMARDGNQVPDPYLYTWLGALGRKTPTNISAQRSPRMPPARARGPRTTDHGGERVRTQTPTSPFQQAKTGTGISAHTYAGRDRSNRSTGGHATTTHTRCWALRHTHR